MDFTQSFEEFSKGVSSTDLALYAGVGLVVWVLFKEKLTPLGQYLKNLVSQARSNVKNTLPKNPIPSLADLTLITPSKNDTVLTPQKTIESDDVFFELILSWKKTRDLAIKAGCEAAVKVVDEMFPYLNPEVCKEEKTHE
jgi:hypothetical protein